jgi:ATP-dependent Lhr-like helicase
VSLEHFSPATRTWFEQAFDAPTPAQDGAWDAIAKGENTLVLAPTGSGKTLAAFLWAIDRLATEPAPEPADRCRVLYISPLKALAVDVERNLNSPLTGIRLAADRISAETGEPLVLHEPVVGIRTGDTPARERAAFARHPPDILVTTPESLYLMLTSRAREGLKNVRWVIIDEIHAMAPTKRGAHLMLSLERLEELVGAHGFQRIGLSATQRPLEEVARFLGGNDKAGAPRPVTLVNAGSRKVLDLDVVVPVENLAAMGDIIDETPSGPASAGRARASIWPYVEPKLLELVQSHRSTLVFVNSRRLAERLASRLNELAIEGGHDGPPLVKAHHGSLAREQRTIIEDDLKQGRLRGLVATSSLELGIDMGAIDLVVLVESPGSVARGIQRVGRAGHQVGQPSTGTVFPKFRGDLLESAVVVQRMQEGLIEETHYLRNPLDVLAQQMVAMTALDEWGVDDLRAVVRRCACFADLTDLTFDAVLDLLTGRYPSDEFAGLRPLLVWDRVQNRVRARAGAQRIAVTSGGTIPDRGLFGVFLPEGQRVGELDEEMVYECRPGEAFQLGASTWRIEQITHDRVIVTPAPGEPAKTPFWKGDRPGRPAELGRAIGAFVREMAAAKPEQAHARLRADFGLDEWAADNLLAYIEEQREATGVLPDDRTIVVERFPDELGDWRICILTPFGARIHAPWALALETRLEERLDSPIEVLWSDDGIVLRLPEAVEQIPLDDLLISPEDAEALVVERIPSTSMFAARFREASARALLLPRRRPGSRTPLWMQRQRAANLLEVAGRYPEFPMLLEATRECLRDEFDVPALLQILTDLRSREIRAVAVDTRKASPFAQSLLYGWIAVYMYESDSPLAERRATALALDADLLRDLLGTEELRELLDPEAIDALELELQHLTPIRQARDADELHDILRDLGDLTPVELAARSQTDPTAWIEELLAQRRAIHVRVGRETRIAAAEDASRFRDALGVALPPGLPEVFLTPVAAPLLDLVSRYARTHAPFTSVECSGRLGLGEPTVKAALAALDEAGRVAAGEFRPGGNEREWCDVEVLRLLRRRSLAALRREIEPVDPEVYARFLPSWQGVSSQRHGVDALLDAVGVLQGAPIPASVFETDVLPARLSTYRAADLDELCTLGEVVWCGAGSIGANDGRIVVCFRDQAGVLFPARAADPPQGAIHDAIREHLARAGASFWPDLLRAAGPGADDPSVLAALWDLVWAGEVTNDTLQPLRAALAGKRRQSGSPKARPRLGRLTRLGPPAGAGRWSSTASLREPEPMDTLIALGRTQQLLQRYGVLTREAVRAEGVPGGFASVYGVLRELEDRGQVRRGYFVAGLGAAQFALPGAVDRLRANRPQLGLDHRQPHESIVLAATDPAQPYGAALAWPESAGKPTRSAGAWVVISEGVPRAFLERGGHHLVTFPGTDPADPEWLEALTSLVKQRRLKSLELRRVDGVPARESAWAEALRTAGFRDGYRGLGFHP